MRTHALAPRAARRAACAAFCLAGACAVEPSQAAEYGLGNHLLGLTIPMSGYTPPPGVYFSARCISTREAPAATDYTTGTELHLEGAVIQHLPSGFSFGAGGYHYRQVTGDSGSGARLGSFEGRVTAVGPVLGYVLKAGVISSRSISTAAGSPNSIPRTG